MKERPASFNPDNPEDNKLYTTIQVAEMFAVTPETVRDWIKEGKLPGIVIGGRSYRVRRRDLIAFANHKYGLNDETAD